MTNFDMVKEFMNSFGQNVEDKATLSTESVQRLRVALIEEEFEELVDAMNNDDLVGVADALTDLLYVIYGAGQAFGLNLDKCFEEVHNSNMSKLGGDGNPIYREDGKILKGPNFFEPDLKKCINWS